MDKKNSSAPVGGNPLYPYYHPQLNNQSSSHPQVPNWYGPPPGFMTVPYIPPHFNPNNVPIDPPSGSQPVNPARNVGSTSKRKRKGKRKAGAKLDSPSEDVKPAIDATPRKISWEGDILMHFIKACKEEILAGNRPSTHFTKTGWNNLVKKMVEFTGILFTKKQIKNKWDFMKREWSMYNALMFGESEIVYDAVNHTIKADDAWWDRKIKINPQLAKFRRKNLDVFESHYAGLFRDIITMDKVASAPPENLSQSLKPNEDEDEHTEGSGDSNDPVEVGDGTNEGTNEAEDLEEDLTTKSSSGIKFQGLLVSPKEMKRRSSGSELRKMVHNIPMKDQIQQIWGALAGKPNETSVSTVLREEVPSPSQVLRVLMKIPGVVVGSNLWNEATMLFVTKEYRDIFSVYENDHQRIEWLKYAIRNLHTRCGSIPPEL